MSRSDDDEPHARRPPTQAAGDRSRRVDVTRRTPITLSIVSPVYMAEAVVGRFVTEVTDSLRLGEPGYEIVLVDDGSTDGSWLKIVEKARRDSRVKGIRLERNVGQHRAISIGMTHCQGEAVVIMDCDLQDDPTMIGSLLRAWQSGVDIVFTCRKRRAYPVIRNIASRMFYLLLRIRYGTRLDPAIGTFALVSRRAMTRLLADPLHTKAFLIALERAGLKSTRVVATHRNRAAGTSAYRFGRLVAMGLRLLFTPAQAAWPHDRGIAETINLAATGESGQSTVHPDGKPSSAVETTP